MCDMTDDELVEMANQAGITYVTGHGVASATFGWLDRFAGLVAAREREQCAKVCEDAISSIWEFHPEYVNQVGKNVCNNLAAKIRARGKK